MRRPICWPRLDFLAGDFLAADLLRVDFLVAAVRFAAVFAAAFFVAFFVLRFLAARFFCAPFLPFFTTMNDLPPRMQTAPARSRTGTDAHSNSSKSRNALRNRSSAILPVAFRRSPSQAVPRYGRPEFAFLRRSA